jgi:hypothetical protein
MKGEREGARCKIGDVWGMTIMNCLHVWSLVRPAWELVGELYLPLIEKLVRITRSESAT